MTHSRTVSVKGRYQLDVGDNKDEALATIEISTPLGSGEERYPIVTILKKDLDPVLGLLEDAWKCLHAWEDELSGKPHVGNFKPWSEMVENPVAHLERDPYALQFLGYTEEDGIYFAVDMAVEEADGKGRHLVQLGHMQIPIMIELLKEVA